MIMSVDFFNVLRDSASSVEMLDFTRVFFLNAVITSYFSCFIASSVAGSARCGWLLGVSWKLMTSLGLFVVLEDEDESADEVLVVLAVVRAAGAVV